MQDNNNARLVAAGPMLTVENGYPIAVFNSPSAMVISSLADAREKVSTLISDGADIFKIAMESGIMFNQTIPTHSPAQAAEIVSTAHSKNVKVSAHVLATVDLNRAIAAGVDDIAHMVVTTLPDSTISNMIERNIYWVPTLELWQGVSYDLGETAIGNLSRFVEAGGNVALGTDFDGYSSEFDLGMPIREISWMLEAGMTPIQIIKSSTKNAAFVCGLQDQLGTLETGMLADLFIIDSNPLEDITNLTSVQLVLHNGVIIYQSDAGF